MARTDNLTNFLNDVAAAIKSKLDDSTTIPAGEFDTKIMSIQTKGNYETRTINVTSNGSQTITPNQGYDAIESMVINTQVPLPQLQSKSYEFTDNATITLSPETGYDGFSSVGLTINVPQGQTINNQDKTITQNGVYTADSGYTGLGNVTVNVTDSEYATNLALSNQILGGSSPYTELEYIESTGTQYIDMGMQPSSSFGLDMILQYTEVASPTAYFNTFGCNNGTNAIFLRQNDYGNTTVRFGTFNVSAGTLLQDTNKHTISLRSATMYIDTNLYNLSTNAFTINKNMYLFAFNNNDRVEIERLPKMKLYYTKIYDGFILVRDFIPVKRKSDNEVCLYDKVTNQFFTNQGTDVFTAGPEIN